MIEFLKIEKRQIIIIQQIIFMMKILTNSEVDNRPNPKVCLSTQKQKSNKIFGEYESRNKQNSIKSPKYKFFQEQLKSLMPVFQMQKQQRRLSYPQDDHSQIQLSKPHEFDNEKLDVIQPTNRTQTTQKTVILNQQKNKQLQVIRESNAIIIYYENEIQNLKQIIKFYKAYNKQEQLKHRIKQLEKQNGLIKELVIKTDKQSKFLKNQIQKHKENQQILLHEIKANQIKDRENFILINNYQTTTREYESLKQSMDMLINENQQLKKFLQQSKSQIVTINSQNNLLKNEIDQLIKQLQLSLHLNKDQQLKIQRLQNQLHQQKQANNNLKKMNLQFNKNQERVNFDSNYLSKVIKENKDILNKQKQAQKKNEELQSNLFSSKKEVSSKAKEIQFLTKQLIKLKKCSQPTTTTNLDRLKLEYRQNKENNTSRSPIKKERNSIIIGEKINRIPLKAQKDYKLKN